MLRSTSSPFSSPKQGQIHGYQSRVKVDRGSEKKANSSIGAEAVTPKDVENGKKANGHRLTDKRT